MVLDRVAVLRRGIAPGSARSIEIGPLDNPVLPKDEFDVTYLDYADADELRHKYAADVTRGAIVDVDAIWNSSGPLPADIAARGPFDAVVASHVLEHIPDPIRWLGYLSDVLTPGGTISLALPDKRFSFDVNRRLSEFSDLLDAHLRRDTRPSCAALFDYHTKAVPVDTGRIWDGLVNYAGQVRPGDLEQEAFNGCVALSAGGPYVDVHCHTFTPTSFVDIAERLNRFDLIDLVIAELVPTEYHTFEFFVRLERLDPSLSGAERAARAAKGIADARAAIEAGRKPVARPAAEAEDDGADGGLWYRISPSEKRLIDAKRRAITAVRRRRR